MTKRWLVVIGVVIALTLGSILAVERVEWTDDRMATILWGILMGYGAILLIVGAGIMWFVIVDGDRR